MMQMALQFRILWILLFLSSSRCEDAGDGPVTDNAETAIDIVDGFVKAYTEFLHNNKESVELSEASKRFASTLKKRKIFTKDSSTYSRFDNILANRSCHEGVKIVFDMYRNENGIFYRPTPTKWIIKRTANDVCHRLALATDEVCKGLIDSNYPIIDYIIRNSAIDPHTFCSLVIKGSSYSPNADYNWQISVDDSKDMPASHKKAPSSIASRLKILHLSDFHFDPLYISGALAECAEPLCCQRDVDIYANTSQGAGHWSDYRNCDTPWQLVDDILVHIRETHDEFDFIYYTGDTVDHQVWNTSRKKNAESITTVHERIMELFPNTPVFSAIGNHEPHPLNVFSPPSVPEEINTRWLYEVLYTTWQPWVPDSAKETILKGGYYTVSPRTGFRVIVLNSNDCYTNNWWLYFNGTDKILQLEWLHDTLLAAEHANEHVHILSHIPSGDGTCWNIWARAYNRILARFRETVGAIFNGHSHNDEMNVHYTLQAHAFAISWNGGSLTTFENRNPNYRIYDVESETMQVVDHETWAFNLTEANTHGASKRPQWYREYRFSEEFTKDLSPEGIHTLLEEMADNPQLLYKLWRYKIKTSDPILGWGCDNNCLRDFICRISRTVNNQQSVCYQLKSRLTSSLENDTSATGRLLGVNIMLGLIVVINFKL